MSNEESARAVDPLFAPIVAAFAGDRGVSRKRVFGSESVLSVKGRIFAMLVKGRLVVKLPRHRVSELTESGRGKPFDPGHGRLMKEWVTVEAGRGAWVDLAREASVFVGGAKPGTRHRAPAAAATRPRRPNTDWHLRHALPRSATIDDRIAWHRAHQRRCGCRPIPGKLLQQMKARTGKTGTRRSAGR